jgi:hypothetical protein
MIYTEVIVLNTVYNFAVEKFFIWSRLESQICVLVYRFWNSKFRIPKRPPECGWRRRRSVGGAWVQGQRVRGRGRRPRRRGGVDEEVCWEDHVADGKEGKKNNRYTI